MIEVAKKLCRPFPLVRVDLYDVEDQTIFGELTFTPAAGLDSKRLPETEQLFGSMIDLHYSPD